MKTTLMYLVLIPIVFSISACGSNSSKYAQEAKIEYVEQVLSDEQAMILIEKHFRASDVPWDLDMVSNIEKSRNALMSEAEFLQGRLNVDRTLMYYNYRAGFERTSTYVSSLIAELNTRSKMEGAISEEGKWIYEKVRDDVLDRLELQRTKISMTEKAINEKATQDTIEDMKNIFETIKPLVGKFL